MEPDIGELYLTDKTAFETVARWEAVYFPSSCGNDSYQCCGSGSGPRKAKMTHKSAEFSPLRDEDFFWSLEVLSGCIGMSKLQLIKKQTKISAVFVFIFVHQNLGSGYESGSGFT
jgi:hypothetical protein